MNNIVLKKPFQLGIDPYPDWFKQLDKSRMNFVLREDGTLREVTIQLDASVLTVKAGDILGLINGQITVLPAAAKQYL